MGVGEHITPSLRCRVVATPFESPARLPFGSMQASGHQLLLLQSSPLLGIVSSTCRQSAGETMAVRLNWRGETKLTPPTVSLPWLAVVYGQRPEPTVESVSPQVAVESPVPSRAAVKLLALDAGQWKRLL